MKRLILTTAVLSLVGALAACGQKQTAATEPAAETATTAPPASGSDISKKDMSAGAQMAKGTGTITAVDAKAGTITVDHAPIPEAGWPAMTMGFKATPGLAQSVKVGDKVAFDLKLQDGSGEITAITKR